MSRGPATFKQRDLTAAVKAVVAAGCEVDRVEIGKDGKIVVITSKAKVPIADTSTINEWDASL